MNKIFNWTFGSLFRTFGRIIAYLLIGGLVAIILSSNDFKLPKLSDLLLFERVKAEQITVPVTPRANEFYFGIPSWSTGWSLDSNGNFAKNTITSSSNIQELWLQFSSTSFSSDVDYVEFSFLASQPLQVNTSSSTTSTITGGDYCDRWEAYTYTTNEGVLAWSCEHWYTNPDSTITDNERTAYTSNINNLAFYFELENENGGKPMCTVSGTSVICPTNHIKPSKLHIYVLFDTKQSTTLNFEISRHARGYYVQNQQEVINAINSSTNETIENQNANTNATIENQNQNTQQQIDSQKVCITQRIDKNNCVIDNNRLAGNGALSPSDSYCITDYIYLDNNSTLTLDAVAGSGANYCFYDKDKVLISCLNSHPLGNITIPSNTNYFRSSIVKSSNVPTFTLNVCKNGNQAMTDTMTDDDIGGADDQATSFFDDFEIEDHGGLSGIITAPLNTISSLISNTCTDLVLPLPFVDEDLTLPCLSDIYTEHFGAFFTIYQSILLAIISYRCIRSLFYDTRGFINPEDDRIEVLDL